MHSAVAEGYLEVAKILNDYGANVNLHLEDSSTTLQSACTRENYEVAKYLLEQWAYPTVVNDDG